MYLSLFEMFLRHWSVDVGLTRQDAERISVILAIINSTPHENKTDFSKKLNLLILFMNLLIPLNLLLRN